MLKINHIAIWAVDIELLKNFHEKYFGCKASNKYYNPNKKFQSYFLSFEDGCKLELMNMPDIAASGRSSENVLNGLAHFAVSVGSKTAVDELVNRLAMDGYEVVGQPRMTGDGYYEGIVSDPEGNQIEITE
jgi:lactoylglutathione lyase